MKITQELLYIIIPKNNINEIRICFYIAVL